MASTQRRVALVTGSSRGLGAVIARRLARDGFTVAVNGRPGDEQVAAVGRGLRDEGFTAEGFCADVTDEQQVAGLVAAITGSLGPVDVLVLNATGPQPEAPVTEVAWADHVAQLDFFVKSPVLLGREVLPGMQARRYGRIVSIDSEVAHRPPPAARRRGLGSRLLDHLEAHARDHGVATLRLDTRDDLIEARRLYAGHGYREVRPFSHGPYADHWFEKNLPFGTE